VSGLSALFLRVGLDVERVILLVGFLKLFEPFAAGIRSKPSPGGDSSSRPDSTVPRARSLVARSRRLVAETTASLNAASASISAADRGVTRRANSSSDIAYRMPSPFVTQSRNAATYASPWMTSPLPPHVATVRRPRRLARTDDASAFIDPDAGQ
jgi:hypothetical protein